MAETEVEKAAKAALDAETERAENEAEELAVRTAATGVAAAQAGAALANAEAAKATQNAAKTLEEKEGDIEWLKAQSNASGQALQKLAERQETQDRAIVETAAQITAVAEGLALLTQKLSEKTETEVINPKKESGEGRPEAGENKPENNQPARKKSRFI